MSSDLITSLSKKTYPNSPGLLQNGVAVVSAIASVPTEIKFECKCLSQPVGVDIVFLIDNSLSNSLTDPNNNRLKAIKKLIDDFAPTRDSLDRVSVITFADVVTVEQTALTWSQTRATVDRLINQGPATNPGTYMSLGMKQAHNLLTQLGSFYRLVIMFSDGYPEDALGRDYQTDDIVYNLVPEAADNMILYSTIYLWVQGFPEENTLLWDIAKGTDYVTPNQRPEDPPTYYFKIDNPSFVDDKYRAFFAYLNGRAVPQVVTFSETINPRLCVDGSEPIELEGVVQSNIIGDATTLNQAIQNFKNTGSFVIAAKEIIGTVKLDFSVKLKLNTITDTESSQGYVLIDEDSHVSEISYHSPLIGRPGFEVKHLPLPQAQIKFVTGLIVEKTLHDIESKVQIPLANFTGSSKAWVQLWECPSAFVEAYKWEDDFEFEPFQMILDARILPWYLRCAIDANPNFRNLTQAQQRAYTQRIKNACDFLTQTHSSNINQHLCQFHYFENPQINYAQINQSAYISKDQRGTFKILQTMPSKTQKRLTFYFKKATYWATKNPETEIGFWINPTIDAKDAATGSTLGKYKSAGLPWNGIVPNPNIDLFVNPIPTGGLPDLHVQTCFKIENKDEIISLFQRPSQLQIRSDQFWTNTWELVNSPDIKPIVKNKKIGVSVKVNSSGGPLSSQTVLRVQTIIFPFTGEELASTPKVSTPLIGSSSINIKPTDFTMAQTPKTFQAFYSQLRYLRPTTPGQSNIVDRTFISKIKKAILLTMVDIDPLNNELAVANNKAIEICPFSFQ